MYILIVGQDGGTHVGGSLLRAAQDLDVEAKIRDAENAYDAPWWLTALNWHLFGHRPPYLNTFSQNLVEQVASEDVDVLLTTGMAPVKKSALQKIGEMGVRCINFSTDDPWNPNHKASWFIKALPEYDTIFTARRSNIEDFRALDCDTRYLPFGYDPTLFHPTDLSEQEYERLHSEVLFVGGADDDRAAMLAPLLKSDIDVALYGGYWDDYSIAANANRGWAPPETIRKATRAADVALCLVRRANRDGHVMRSFEIPAVGACMLVEDTAEHRALFGPPEETVWYFETPSHLVDQAHQLLNAQKHRRHLAEAVHCRIVKEGKHTYADRLQSMIDLT